MTDYYTPQLLFRQNAIRRYQPSLSPISSETSISTTITQKANTNSWLLNLNNPKDSQVLSQSCCLDRVNIKSNYWKIPDTNMNLTSLAISPNTSNITPTLAISSGNLDANLFIYQLNLDDNNLTHHCTISLPNIHTMQWINNKYMITGNNKGYAHVVSIPKLTDLEINDEEAEICKRFNHRKHLRNHPDKYKSTSISKLKLYNNDQIVSLYNNHLFQWDINGIETQTKPNPITITNITGISDLDSLPDLSTLAICGKFGVSLFDIRDAKFKIPQYVLPDNFEKFQQLNSNLIKWNIDNTNVLASGHGDGIVRLWDIRKINNCFASLQSAPKNISSITTLQWNKGDIFTGSQDGNIIHWDLTSTPLNQEHTNCTLSEGFNSINFNSRSNTLESIVQQRQCGTILPASNNNIVNMTSLDVDGDNVVVSIDGSSFLGVHAKVTETKEYYTNIFGEHVSEDTLVEQVEQVEQPLRIREKRITSNEPMIPIGIYNESVDTLQEIQEVVVIPDEDEINFGGAHNTESCSLLSMSQVDSPNSTDSVNSFSTLATDVGCDYDKGLELSFNGIFDTLS